MEFTIDSVVYTVTDVINMNGDFRVSQALVTVEDEDGNEEEYYLFEDQELAGEAAKEYWVQLAKHDPEEFSCLVGADNLLKWGLNGIAEYGGDVELAGPGSTKVASVGDWLDLWLNTPEEQWASYDGEEYNVYQASEELCEELGFTPGVAYRLN